MEETLRERAVITFNEYGGWWNLGGMAEWLKVPEEELGKIWQTLEDEGLLERKRWKRN